MINFLLKIKLLRKCKTFPTSNGITYIEVITVLAIFTIMTSVVLYNYRDFQMKVDIKNLAADIALKIVEAQKASLDGKLPPATQQALINTGGPGTLLWKPSYGVYFDLVTNNKQFIYFTDTQNAPSILYNGLISSCTGTDECLDKVTITKNNYISSIYSCGNNDCTNPPPPTSISAFSVVFKRPDYSAIFTDSSGNLIPVNDHIQITVHAPLPSTITAKIKIYPSGRIQIN